MSHPAAQAAAPPADGQLCTVVAFDIAGFTEPYRDDDIRLYLHEELYELLERAFDGSGIPWGRCFHEDRGDGALIVVPPDVACKGIIDPLPERLRGLIRRHNHVSCQAAGIQLRAAAHIGPVEHDGHGFVGSDINLLFRMLEARPLRHALASSGADSLRGRVPQHGLPVPQPGQPGRLPASTVPGQADPRARVDLPARDCVPGMTVTGNRRTRAHIRLSWRARSTASRRRPAGSLR